MRRARNKRLRNAMYHWARVSSQHDPPSKARHAAPARGHGHPRALRSLAGRLLAQLVAMLKHGSLYEPDRARRVPAGAATG